MLPINPSRDYARRTLQKRFLVYCVVLPMWLPIILVWWLLYLLYVHVWDRPRAKHNEDLHHFGVADETHEPQEDGKPPIQRTTSINTKSMDDLELTVKPNIQRTTSMNTTSVDDLLVRPTNSQDNAQPTSVLEQMPSPKASTLESAGTANQTTLQSSKCTKNFITLCVKYFNLLVRDPIYRSPLGFLVGFVLIVVTSPIYMPFYLFLWLWEQRQEPFDLCRSILGIEPSKRNLRYAAHDHSFFNRHVIQMGRTHVKQCKPLTPDPLALWTGTSRNLTACFRDCSDSRYITTLVLFWV